MVDEALQAGVVVYWLGPEFAAGGLTFDQIDPSLGTAEDGRVTAMNFHYFVSEAEAPDGSDTPPPIDGAVDVRSIHGDLSADAAGLPNRAQFYDVVDEEVLVRGAPAELITLWLRAGPPNSMVLILRHEDGAVRLRTSAFLSSEGDQINPVMDKEVFLRVAESLQPYEAE